MKFRMLVVGVSLMTVSLQAAANTGTETTLENVQEQKEVSLLEAETEEAESSTQTKTENITVESKAEEIRRARQEAELATEQKIQEKLEEDRLREEQERAERLLGEKKEAEKQSEKAVTSETTEAQGEEKGKATQPAVIIEKIEIVQPVEKAAETTAEKASTETVKPVEQETIREDVIATPTAENRIEVANEAEGTSTARSYFIGASLGGMDYDASNVKENFGLGFVVGTLIDFRWAVEAGLFYSNHYVDTFWEFDVYRELHQYDFQVNGKYYLLTGDIKPYVGAGVAYIYRKYEERIKEGAAWFYNPNKNTEDTHAVNLTLLAGAEFQVSNNVAVGAGLEWSHNILNKSEIIYSDYALPANSKALEQIDYLTVKVTGKFTF